MCIVRIRMPSTLACDTHLDLRATGRGTGRIQDHTIRSTRLRARSIKYTRSARLSINFIYSPVARSIKYSLARSLASARLSLALVDTVV